MRPHYSHSSRENATPSSGTSLLASCKEVPPPPRPRGESWLRCAESQLIGIHSTKGLVVQVEVEVEVPGHTMHPALLSDTVVNDTYKSKRSDLNNGM